MQEAKVTSNPLIQSVIHKSFIHAITDIGLPEFPQPILMRVESPLPDDEVSRAKLYKSVMRGEVIATEARDDGSFVFYVRGSLGTSGYHMRLVCLDKRWYVEAPPTLYPRSVVQSRWFYPSTLVASVILAAIIGYSLHGSSQGPAQTVAVVPSASSTAHSHPSTGTHTANPQSPQGTTVKLPTGQTADRTVAVSLSPGMALYDFSQLLVTNHLVSDAMSFDMLMKKTGIDTDVKPGVYHFTTGMTERQIIQVLQRGPTS